MPDLDPRVGVGLFDDNEIGQRNDGPAAKTAHQPGWYAGCPHQHHEAPRQVFLSASFLIEKVPVQKIRAWRNDISGVELVLTARQNPQGLPEDLLRVLILSCKLLSERIEARVLIFQPGKSPGPLLIGQLFPNAVVEIGEHFEFRLLIVYLPDAQQLEFFRDHRFRSRGRGHVQAIKPAAAVGHYAQSVAPRVFLDAQLPVQPLR